MSSWFFTGDFREIKTNSFFLMKCVGKTQWISLKLSFLIFRYMNSWVSELSGDLSNSFYLLVDHEIFSFTYSNTYMVSPRGFHELMNFKIVFLQMIILIKFTVFFPHPSFTFSQKTSKKSVCLFYLKLRISTKEYVVHPK